METCSDCNYVFPENQDSESDPRIPCPKCGSTKRTYTLSVEPLHIQHSIITDVTLTINSAPPFSFGAIIHVEGVMPEGQIITLVDPFYTHLISEIEKDPEIIYRIDHRKWEEIIAAAYDRAGFDEVILTPRSGDRGRDVIAIKKGYFSVKFIDQMKAYKPGHVVTADEVRALIGVLYTERDASKAIFTTTSTFAPKIIEDESIMPLIPYRLELVDKDKLIKRLISGR